MSSTAAARQESQPADYVARARSLAALIDANVEEIDRIREVPRPLLEELLEAGLFRMLIPRHLDGPEVDPLTFARAIEELASADASATWCVGQTAVTAMFASYMKREAAEAVFKADRRAVMASGPETPDSRAVAVEGGYRVTAKWNFCSGGRHSNWLGGNCPVYETDGKPRLGADGLQVRRTMVFPTAKASRTDVWQVMGLRGTGSDQYAVKDLFVPQAYTMTEDPEERHHRGGLYNFTIVGMYGVSFAATAIGVARRMVASFLDLAGAKTPRGGRQTLRENAVVQSDVAQNEARLRAVRAYLHGTLGELWEEAKDGDRMLSLEQRMRLRLATVHAINESKLVCEAMYQAAGATAIFNSQPFERRFRDMHAISQQINGHKANYETIGKFLLGIEVPASTYLLRRG